MFSNWQYRVLAVVLALICWYLVTGREKVDTWVEVPVELVQAPEDMVITQGLTAKINVRIRGPKPLVRGLDPKRLAYSLDLSALVPGKNSVPFDSGRVPLPGALKVVEFDPVRMVLEVDRLVRKTVPVQPRWEGTIDPDFELTNASSRPAAVELHGPQTLLEGMVSVPTAPLSVNSTRPAHISLDAGFDLPGGVDAAPGEVRIDLYFSEKTVETWIKIPVKAAAGGPARVSFRPSSVKVRVAVPVGMSRIKNFAKDFAALVDVAPDTEPGRRDMAFSVVLPPGCRLIKSVPDKVMAVVGK